jgi:hypothetical protein
MRFRCIFTADGVIAEKFASPVSYVALGVVSALQQPNSREE